MHGQNHFKLKGYFTVCVRNMSGNLIAACFLT